MRMLISATVQCIRWCRRMQGCRTAGSIMWSPWSRSRCSFCLSFITVQEQTNMKLRNQVWAVNGYPGTRYWAITGVVKLWTGTRGNKGQQEKLTEEEQKDHARDERLPKLVSSVDCSLFSYLYCTNFLQLDAYLGWLLCEMVCMFNI